VKGVQQSVNKFMDCARMACFSVTFITNRAPLSRVNGPIV
jgi:hypothetical protein